jgi:hypothetical protein
MDKLKKTIYSELDKLRSFLDSYNNEMIFSKREEPNRMNQRSESILNAKINTLSSLYWYITVYDHNATPITSLGQLENVLKGTVEQFLHKNRRLYYENVYREELKDRLGRGWTREPVKMESFPLWLVNADSHS